MSKGGRPYEMPDPDDRSPNSPHTTIERPALIGLYNQAHPNAEAKNVSEGVRDWFKDEAKSAGWAEVIFVDSAAVLRADIIRK